MTDETDKMLGKIKALLAKAESRGVTPHEAEALSAKACELMAKYSITVAMIDATGAAEAREIPERKVFGFAGETYPQRKRSLLYNIALAHRCDGVICDGRLVLFGFAADLDLVTMLYLSLLVQAARALASTPVPAGAHPRSFRTGWWHGYVSRIVTRLRDVNAQATSQVTRLGAEVVLRERWLAVQDAMRAEFPSTQTVRSNSSVDPRGYAAGQAAGDRADLGGSPLPGRRAAEEALAR